MATVQPKTITQATVDDALSIRLIVSHAGIAALFNKSAASEILIRFAAGEISSSHAMDALHNIIKGLDEPAPGVGNGRALSVIEREIIGHHQLFCVAGAAVRFDRLQVGEVLTRYAAAEIGMDSARLIMIEAMTPGPVGQQLVGTA